MPEIGPPPEPINSTPVDKKTYWTILDQTKAEFKKDGRSCVVITVGEDAASRKKVADFCAKYETKFDVNTPKPYFVIEHATQCEALFKEALAAGLTAELIQP